MSPCLLKLSHIVMIHVEGEEMIASRMHSSCCTTASLEWSLDGKLIDLRWEAISIYSLWLELFRYWNEVEEMRSESFCLMSQVSAETYLWRERVWGSIFWRVDKENPAISSSRCCLSRLEIWQQHKESVSIITRVFINFLVRQLLSQWSTTLSCSNYWQQESTG
jgi:hypothetical protein